MVQNFGYAYKKRYTRSTLKTWKKEELLDYIEVLENNERAMIETLQQQARNFEVMLEKIKYYKPVTGMEGEE